MGSMIFNNVLPSRGCDKLYLHSRTSDVHFTFRSGEIEKVPAHKSILSIISPVFDAMFYGPNKQDGDIDIVDTTPEAFKEFLQFFYCSQVKLTAENVAKVLNLGRQYLLDDWQTVSSRCTDLCVKALTLDNMCMGYELAILFELSTLKKFCEKRIGENAAAVFRSSSFLSCQRSLLRHILQLHTLECDELVVFDGCMAWAKAECMRKRCDENDVQNLRAQLGDLFYQIRFGEFTQKDFNHRYRLYEGLFSLEEFRDITMMIVDGNFHPVKFTRCSRSVVTIENHIVCDRRWSGSCNFTRSTSITKFSSTSKLLLKKISCFLLSCGPAAGSSIIDAKVRIYDSCTEDSRGRLNLFMQTSLNANTDTIVELSVPILILPGIKYAIEFELLSNVCAPRAYEKIERIENGIRIDFIDDGHQSGSFLSGLHFVQ